MAAEILFETRPICPYCGHDFKVMPGRGRKCPACKGDVRIRKPFPYTSADADVPKVMMSLAQAEAEEATWTTHHRVKFIQENGFDPHDRRSRHRKKREWFHNSVSQARRVQGYVAIEVKAAPHQPCEHTCIGFWDIHDCSDMPPEDCPHEYCLCSYKVVHQDEIKGRFIAGWRTYDN